VVQVLTTPSITVTCIVGLKMQNEQLHKDDSESYPCPIGNGTRSLVAILAQHSCSRSSECATVQCVSLTNKPSLSLEAVEVLTTFESSQACPICASMPLALWLNPRHDLSGSVLRYSHACGLHLRPTTSCQRIVASDQGQVQSPCPQDFVFFGEE
jgi:hypothetical protein